MNKQSNDQTVVLINPFVVPAGSVEDAITMWEQARDYLKTQPGYISTKLHQAKSADAKFTLINVACWESAEAFRLATMSMRENANLSRVKNVFGDPQLYEVIRE